MMVCCLLGLLLEFCRKCGIQEDRKKCRDQVGLLHDEDDGLDETLESSVVTFVGEDVVEPSWNAERGQTQGESAGSDKPISSGPF